MGMPLYVSKRVSELLTGAAVGKRVLILGVAYKPGVRDVRETPVTALRDDLIARGYEVAWHDPLVADWEGSAPVDLSWACDVAVIATAQPGMRVEEIAARGIPILDCTGVFKDLANVVRL